MEISQYAPILLTNQRKGGAMKGLSIKYLPALLLALCASSASYAIPAPVSITVNNQSGQVLQAGSSSVSGYFGKLPYIVYCKTKNTGVFNQENCIKGDQPLPTSLPMGSSFLSAPSAWNEKYPCPFIMHAYEGVIGGYFSGTVSCGGVVRYDGTLDKSSRCSYHFNRSNKTIEVPSRGSILYINAPPSGAH